MSATMLAAAAAPLFLLLLAFQYPKRGPRLGFEIRWPRVTEAERQRVTLQLVHAKQGFLGPVRRQRDLRGVGGGLDLARAIHVIAGGIDFAALIAVDGKLSFERIAARGDKDAPSSPEPLNLFLQSILVARLSAGKNQQADNRCRRKRSHENLLGECMALCVNISPSPKCLRTARRLGSVGLGRRASGEGGVGPPNGEAPAAAL